MTKKEVVTMNIVGNKHSKYIHILVAEQNGVQLVLEIQFSLKVVLNEKTKKEEYHLAEKTLFIRPYIFGATLEEKYTFPSEVDKYDLKQAYQIMVLLVNSAKIKGLNFINKLEDALTKKDLNKISRWLGKDHSLEQVQKMLGLKLNNPFNMPLRPIKTVNLLITTKSEPFHQQLTKYLQTHITV